MTRGDFEHDVRPGVGIGALVLGMTEDEVRAMVGDPTAVDSEDFGDGIIVRTWGYDAQQLSLSFSEDDDFRLGTIASSCEWATLGDSRIVGLAEGELRATQFGALGPPVLDDDFEESWRNYVWDELNLSCWLSDGVVTSVTVMVLFDESGNVPQWPVRDAP
ncbi:MAG: hypothetical protein CMJ83_12790 [Planctomycetes bacterium]|nr:hypothetical protein [Planctomycetota bacterium]